MIYQTITATLFATAASHGIFWSPTSRAVLSEQSGYMKDATTIISEPMPDVASGRPYPGGRPFAEPGYSVSNVGPCGQETYDSLKTNWNHPEHNWGYETVATYSAGQVIDVEWCVSNDADHGGLYSYRVCTEDSIVANFINPNYTPNSSDWTNLENCFQKGQLKCTDVDGQNCAIHPDCNGTGWGCSKEGAKSWFACGPKDNGRCRSKGVGSCKTHNGDGTILRDRVKLPSGFTSNHTLLGFRWDCEDTGQLWLHCSDIKIV
mmetsp:Transcript_2647/g.2632  ORF Transcript_2647/g.2632 Transcript_2647/m.2632 type:complete len:262 (-) Transcript_2647:254-1039(-)|eukprot:CAMPEP_0174821202 /NCGR_PEP_ID=MMETSP1107-20130205/5997_1 /TAXON_ID=36770 /ORGANISM="Paraphysomonas vestita, Strain GFlagA" /LENGTH=261 /DNA_ID=CAMNT_0016037989 /DNA_START=33 /DNA_END=818 /DNA_ORIENTATION=+